MIMKKIQWILCAVLAIGALSGCEKDLQLYDTDTCWLNFYYDIENRSKFEDRFARDAYSFVYGEDDRTRDTLWYEIQAMGFVYDHDRQIAIEQVTSDGNQAVPGKHYVAFDDPSLSGLYVMPAHQSRTKIPVVVLRDASLKQQTVTLKFVIKANDSFIPGYEEYNARYLTITDMLSEPSKWSYAYPLPGWTGYYNSLSDWFGTYGVVKHQFLIEKTGKKWDDEYIDSLLDGVSSFTYLNYYAAKLKGLLAEENAQRQAQGLDVLKESDGTVVEIPY